MTDRAPPLPSPYLMEEQPTSSGRVLLAKAFEHHCALEWGLSGGEIAAAFAGTGDAAAQANVRMGARLVGQILARGSPRAWVRPFGGGEPAPLRANAWELDDFSGRLATSAIDPSRPFDPEASPTHWIFLDLDEWNEVTAALFGVAPATRRSPPRASLLAAGQPQGSAPPQSAPEGGLERLLRLPEVTRRTGLSRSTIYRRMDAGRFPQAVPLGPNITAWRESEVAHWLVDPT